MLILLLGATLAFAEAPATDSADGLPADVHYGVCVSCHGAHGEGRPELATPRLGDLSATYIMRQLEMFRAGTRGGHPADPDAKPMVALAKGLPSAEIVRMLADHAAGTQPEHRDAPKATGLESKGRSLYAPCVNCHGADARGLEALGAPDLMFQDTRYLARQLRNYRDGVRGAEGAHPLAQAMAAMAKPLTDDDVDAVVAYVASLRPERPPVEQYPVTVTEDEGLAAFADIYTVITHPRCMNCHPDGDAPLVGEDSTPHPFGISRFSPLKGVHCSTCHAPAQVGDGQAPLPPADTIWSIAPAQMVFEDRTPAQICAQLNDPAINGGRGHVGSTEHIAHDHLLITSWHKGRPAPPLTHGELVERFETWGRAGGPCPSE